MIPRKTKRESRVTGSRMVRFVLPDYLSSMLLVRPSFPPHSFDLVLFPLFFIRLYVWAMGAVSLSRICNIRIRIAPYLVLISSCSSPCIYPKFSSTPTHGWNPSPFFLVLFLPRFEILPQNPRLSDSNTFSCQKQRG